MYRGVSVGWARDEEAAPVVAERLPGRRTGRTAASRFPTHGSAQLDPRRGTTAARDEDHRAQDGFDLPPIPDRRRGIARAGHRRGRGVPGGAARSQPSVKRRTRGARTVRVRAPLALIELAYW